MQDATAILLQALMQTGAVVLVGAAWATAVFAPGLAADGRWRSRMTWLVTASALMVVIASLATVPLTLLRVLGRSDLSLMRGLLLGTGQGEAILWRSALAIAMLVLLLVAWRRPRPRYLAVGVLVLGLLFVDTYARVSHGASMGGWTLRALDGFHLYLAGAWGGGLWALAIWPWWSRTAPATALPRLSRTGITAVALLFISGLVAARSHLDPPGLLITSTYGWAFIAKQVLVAATLVLAAWNRFRLMPRMRASDLGDAGRRAMAAGLRWEAWVLVTVLIATAVLTTRSLPHP